MPSIRVYYAPEVKALRTKQKRENARPSRKRMYENTLKEDDDIIKDIELWQKELEESDEFTLWGVYDSINHVLEGFRVSSMTVEEEYSRSKFFILRLPVLGTKTEDPCEECGGACCSMVHRAGTGLTLDPKQRSGFGQNQLYESDLSYYFGYDDQGRLDHLPPVVRERHDRFRQRVLWPAEDRDPHLRMTPMCPMFEPGEGKCSIYTHRPISCHGYSCVTWYMGGDSNPPRVLGTLGAIDQKFYGIKHSKWDLTKAAFRLVEGEDPGVYLNAQTAIAKRKEADGTRHGTSRVCQVAN